MNNNSPDQIGDTSLNTPRVFTVLAILAVVTLIGVYWSNTDNEAAANSSTPALSNIVPTETDEENQDLDTSEANAAMTIQALSIKRVDKKYEVENKKLTALVEKLRDEMMASKRESDIQLRALVDEVTKMNSQNIANHYRQTNESHTGGTSNEFELGDLNDLSLLDSDKTTEKSKPSTSQERSNAHPYGDDYILIDAGSITAASTHNQNMSTFKKNDTDLTGLSNNLYSPFDTAKHNTDKAIKDANRAGSAITGHSADRTEPVSIAHRPLESRKKAISVPAASFVEVTLLHGVACPIGGSLGGSLSASIPGRPVVIPVVGIFRGPNGFEVDLGTAHLKGLCAGRRTADPDVGRAEIQISHISYWDSQGGAQDPIASGYIVDGRDNELDVAGYIDKASMANLGKEAFAASMAAAATTLSQSEFTQVVGSNSSAKQFLTGNDVKASGAMGVAGLFNKIAQRYERESNSAIDTVRIPPGIPLRFYLDNTVTVFEAADPIESGYASLYDIAI